MNGQIKTQVTIFSCLVIMIMVHGTFAKNRCRYNSKVCMKKLNSEEFEGRMSHKRQSQFKIDESMCQLNMYDLGSLMGYKSARFSDFDVTSGLCMCRRKLRKVKSLNAFGHCHWKLLFRTKNECSGQPRQFLIKNGTEMLKINEFKMGCLRRVKKIRDKK